MRNLDDTNPGDAGTRENNLGNPEIDLENTENDVDELNQQLDELNHALDDLEVKNELIQAQLRELLQSNRALRAASSSSVPNHFSMDEE